MNFLFVCDLDGTLVDSAPEILKAMNLALGELGLPSLELPILKTLIGEGIARLVERTLAYLGAPPSWKDTTFDLFEKHYGKMLGHEAQLYPGVLEGLTKLKNHAFLAVVTNKSERFTIPLLSRLHIFDYFNLVLSGDVLPKKKPDPEPLYYCANYFSVATQNIVLLGDSRFDIACAQRAGAHPWAVRYGYGAPEDITAAEYLFNHFEDAVQKAVETFS